MKLVLFDCDGTLVDSQASIVAAMIAAFARHDLAPPERAAILRIVGLSLPEAVARLAPAQSVERQRALAADFRDAAQAIRMQVADDPLFAGADAAVRALAGRGDACLGMATGKSMRGVRRLIAQNGWHEHFATLQTADDNPSKPHPAMIERAIAATGSTPQATVMIGDTSYDMQMARTAGVRAIGVAWGYHDVAALRAAGAEAIAESFAALIELIEAPPQQVRR
jgi:phosphoglycolate phosphatase